MTDKLLLTLKEVQEMIGVSRTRIYAMANAGELPCIRIGKSIRISAVALREWVAEQIKRETERRSA